MPGDPALALQQAHPLDIVGLAQHLMPMGLVPQGGRHFVCAEVPYLFAQAPGLLA
ncbi:hypothetical protein D3C80_2064560 [compost metagenome]